jgi:hypothetical protein
MLSVAGEHLEAMNPQARLTIFGQELNPESYAICKADMLIRGQDVGNIIRDNTLSNDGHAHRQFDYMLSNPLFGVEWKKVEKEVRAEHEKQGFNGRFGPRPSARLGWLAPLPHAPPVEDAPSVKSHQLGNERPWQAPQSPVATLWPPPYSACVFGRYGFPEGAPPRAPCMRQTLRPF